MGPPDIFHFYNKYHLGDNLLNLKFFFNISPLLKSKKIIINYYYDNNYTYNSLNELEKYVDSSVVLLKHLHTKPHDAIELWMGNKMEVSHKYFDEYFSMFYKKIMQHLDLDCADINTNIWQDEPYLLSVYNALDMKYKNIDIFIINNTGQSLQYKNNKPLNDLANYLNSKFNVLVTKFINNKIKCTSNLTVQQYGAISTLAKYVIAVHSGSGTGCYNSFSKEYVKKWFFISDNGEPVISSVNSETISNENMNTIRKYFDTLSLAGQALRIEPPQ